MNILTVIPLTRSKVASELSYFTASDMPIGAIVLVPLRSKSIYAIVTKVEPAEDLKLSIKNAPYEIRKLGKVKATAFFPAKFIEACKSLSEYYAANVGAIIDSLVSDVLLENASDIVPPLPPQATFGLRSSKETNLRHADNIYAVQGDDSDRMSSWRSLIRQEFARKKSIAIYAPTIEDCEMIYNSLEKGIEGYIFMQNSGMTKKKILDVWTKIANTDHPVVIIATATFSLLPRGDIETIIIERENGRGWISQKAPYMDLRHAIETVSSSRGQVVFIADSLLRTETLSRLDNNEINASSPFKWRSISTAKDRMIDMRKTLDVNHSDEQNEFRIISDELHELIRSISEENTQLFILVQKRGVASTTVCDDCETIVLCNNCKAPIVLHTSPETGKNFFMCHRCGERRSANETCVNCGGWRLTPLGIGIDRVYAELKAQYPDMEIFRIDADSTKTEKQISDVIAKFKARPGSILLGTELAMLHYSEKVDHVAVVSLDSFFALPDFRIQEKVMYTIIRLRAQATRSIIVQTRKAEEQIFDFGLKGNLSDFYRNTLSDRKQYSYPPFMILVKITIEGKKDKIAPEMAGIQKQLEPYEMDIFPAFTSTTRGNSAIHGLIKVEPHAWPDQALVAKLRVLPPNVSVKINPESLL